MDEVNKLPKVAVSGINFIRGWKNEECYGIGKITCLFACWLSGGKQNKIGPNMGSAGATTQCVN